VAVPVIVKEGACAGGALRTRSAHSVAWACCTTTEVAWNIIHVGKLVEQLCSEGMTIDDATLSLTTPLMRKHLNPFGRYHLDLKRIGSSGE